MPACGSELARDLFAAMTAMMTPLPPAKGYRALREGRHSEAGGFYFLTFCSLDRLKGLSNAAIASAIIAEIDAMQADEAWTLHCGTIMPDHVHLLIELGQPLSLGKTIARLKAKTAANLRDRGLNWQPGYFDHRLRPREERLPYCHYTHLNPYRADLLRIEEKWPWFICSPTNQKWFVPMLNQELPEPTWLTGLP